MFSPTRTIFKDRRADNAQEDSAVTVIVKGEIEKKPTSNRLVIKKSEHLASMVALQFSLWQETGSNSWLEAMLAMMEDASPELKHGPCKSKSSNQGIAAFYDFSRDLTQDEAASVVKELKV